MGAGSWNPGSYRSFTHSTRGKSLGEVFATDHHTYHAKKAAGAKDSLDPLGVKLRESRDSDVNPQSHACIIGLDVTGSMGHLADHMAREGLGVCFEEILSRKPITDPHLMFMAIGDCKYDSAPLQVSQFEADDRIIKQLTDIYIEHGGGGNHYENYNLPWYFAATHTSIDCFEKRGKKGYLFTVGDEEAPGPLLRSEVKQFIGDDVERDLTNADLLAMVGRSYNVFHVIVAEGSHARSAPDAVRKTWANTLGQRALWLADHSKLSEVIVSAIQINEGEDADKVVSSWKGDTSVVVATAVRDLIAAPGASKGVKRL